MKTTLTTSDFDLLTFAAGVLGSNKDTRMVAEGLIVLRNRQRELADEPDAKEPPAEPPLPKRFKFRRRSQGNAVQYAKFEPGFAGEPGWRVGSDLRPGKRGQGWHSEKTVRERFATGAWTYAGLIPDDEERDAGLRPERYRGAGFGGIRPLYQMDADNAQWLKERAQREQTAAAQAAINLTKPDKPKETYRGC